MADYALDLFGSGEDVKLLIFAALERRFGPFDDVREIILKPNPKLRKSREDQFVRDTAPPPSAEMTFLAGWGDIRTDCVIGRFAKNELYLNTWLYDAVRALNLHYWMTEYAKANQWAEAMQCAGRLGTVAFAMKANGNLILANKSQIATLNRRKNITKHNARTADKKKPRNTWIIEKAKQIRIDSPNIGVTSLSDEISDSLRSKISDEKLDWNPASKITVYRIIKHVFSSQ